VAMTSLPVFRDVLVNKDTGKDDVSTEKSEFSPKLRRKSLPSSQTKPRSTSGPRATQQPLMPDNSTTVISPPNLLDMPGTSLHKKTATQPNIFALPTTAFEMRKPTTARQYIRKSVNESAALDARKPAPIAAVVKIREKMAASTQIDPL